MKTEEKYITEKSRSRRGPNPITQDPSQQKFGIHILILRLVSGFVLPVTIIRVIKIIILNFVRLTLTSRRQLVIKFPIWGIKYGAVL